MKEYDDWLRSYRRRLRITEFLWSLAVWIAVFAAGLLLWLVLAAFLILFLTIA